MAKTKNSNKVTKEEKEIKDSKKNTKKNQKNKITKKTTVTKKVEKKKNNEKSYAQEVKTELKKVKWPSKKEITKYGIASVVFLIVFGLYFYGLDALFVWISSLVKGL